MTAATQTPEHHWTTNLPQVRKAIAFIRQRKGGVTADELVSWDLAHGRRLFTWTDDRAAERWRLHEANLFMNRFRGMFDKMRVRGYVHIHEDKDAKIDRSAYFTVEAIAAHPGMREQVIADLTKRMKTLASELAMWKLSQPEQLDLFDKLRQAINSRHQRQTQSAA